MCKSIVFGVNVKETTHWLKFTEVFFLFINLIVYGNDQRQSKKLKRKEGLEMWKEYISLKYTRSRDEYYEIYSSVLTYCLEFSQTIIESVFIGCFS